MIILLRRTSPSAKTRQPQTLTTGRWLKPPELFRTGEQPCTTLESKGGVEFIRVRANQIQLMRNAEMIYFQLRH